VDGLRDVELLFATPAPVLVEWHIFPAMFRGHASAVRS
jgi:hypothetical protein